MSGVEAETEEAEVELDEEERRVYHWRLDHFLDELGFDRGQAQMLAMSGADWHTAERLLKNGCPIGLVFELLSP